MSNAYIAKCIDKVLANWEALDDTHKGKCFGAAVESLLRLKSLCSSSS